MPAARATFCALLLAAASALAQPNTFPIHAEWQAGVEAAKQALAREDPDALGAALRRVFGEAMRMPDADARLAETAAVFSQTWLLYERLDRHAELIELLEALNAMTQERNGLLTTSSFTPAEMLWDILMSDRDISEARALMADVRRRAEADFGAAHPTARASRSREALSAAAVGDYDYALEQLSYLAEVTRRSFGTVSLEYAEVLVSMAQIHADREQFAELVTLADEADAVFDQLGTIRSDLIIELAQLYSFAGAFAKAREAYQQFEMPQDFRSPDYATTNAPILVELAYLNARLGDGASARAYLNRAVDVAESLTPDQTLLRMQVILRAADVYGLAEHYDEAADAIEQYRQVAEAAGIGDAAWVKQRLVPAYFDARLYTQAAALADELLESAEPGSRDYARASTLVAFGGAALEPPVPHTDLAAAAVEYRRRTAPSSEPYVELYALALSYAAEGRWQESADLQRRILSEQAERRDSDYAVSWAQWRKYADTLEQLGRTTEARDIRARVDAEQSAVALAFAEAESGLAMRENNAFGFRVSLTDHRWRRWDGMSTGWPMAAFTANYYGERSIVDGTLAVLPILLSEDVTTDIAIMTLAAAIGLDPSALTPWSDGSTVGYEYSFNQTSVPGKPYTNRGRLLVDGHGVYLVAAMADRSNPDALEAARAAIDAVHLTDEVSPADLTGSNRLLHGVILNSVGVALAGSGRVDEALAMYFQAREFNPADMIWRNIVGTLLRFEDYQAVYDELQNYPRDLRDAPEFLVSRAHAQLQMERYDEAIADYRAAFDAGVRDDDAAYDYASLLLAFARNDEALSFLDGYAAAGLTPGVIATQALVSLSLDDTARLDEALARLADPALSNPDGAYLAGVIVLQRDGLPGLAPLVAQLERAGLASTDIYALLVEAQIEAGQLAEARATLDRALRLEPSDTELNALADHLRTFEDQLL